MKGKKKGSEVNLIILKFFKFIFEAKKEEEEDEDIYFNKHISLCIFFCFTNYLIKKRWK